MKASRRHEDFARSDGLISRGLIATESDYSLRYYGGVSFSLTYCDLLAT